MLIICVALIVPIIILGFGIYTSNHDGYAVVGIMTLIMGIVISWELAAEMDR